MESVVILKDYFGSGFFGILYLAALVYLIVCEKEKWKRLILVYVPILLLAAFLCPITRKGFVAVMDEGNTYYRLLWLVPFGITICYAGCKAFEKHRRIGLAAMCILVVICGKFVYSSSLITKAENHYHIPQTVIDICDIVDPIQDGNRVRAAFPSELVYFVRQYNTDILLPFGREMVEQQWDYYNAVYEVMEKPDEICAKDLVEATRETKCSFVILATGRKIDEDPADLGLVLVATVGDYYVYSDPTVTGTM